MTAHIRRPLPRRSLVWLFVIVVALAAPLAFRSDTALNIGILLLLYATLAQAWNILGGLAGQISFGNAVFFGIGAYTSTLFLVRAGVSPWLGMLAGAVLALVVALLVGFPMFRLGGHYFAIATIALGEIASTIVTNWDAVGGATGIVIPLVRDAQGQPSDSWRMLQFNQSRLPYYYLALVLLALTTLATALILRSKLGYYFRAIRNDQQAARALGVAVLRYKLAAIALSAIFTAIAGTLYAQYLLYIDPETTMRLDLSVLAALIAILGGVGTVAGPLIGAAVMVPMSELTRAFLGGGGNAIDLLLYGGLIVLISLFEPQGLIGIGRRFRRSPRPQPVPVEPAPVSGSEEAH